MKGGFGLPFRADTPVVKIDDGLEYETFIYRESAVHMLKVDLTKRTVKPTVIGPEYPLNKYYSGETRLPNLAKSQHAIATVNGDFRCGIEGQSCNLFVKDREIWQLVNGFNLYIGDGHAGIQKAKSFVTLRHLPTEKNYRVHRINSKQQGTWLRWPLVAWTPRGGTYLFAKGNLFCVRITPTTDWVDLAQGGQRRIMEVTEIGTNLPHVENSIVLEFKFSKAKIFHLGDAVTWTQNFGYPGTVHVIGAMTGVLKDGEDIVHLLDIGPGHSNGPDNWYYQKNPRTAFGVSQDKKTLFLYAVQGRGVDGSPGLRLKELGAMMRERGAWDATNTDGGGSTLMWIRNQPNHGLVLDSSYGDGTAEGTRPLIQGTAVW